MTKISAQELPLVADTEGVFSPAAVKVMGESTIMVSGPQPRLSTAAEYTMALKIEPV